MAQLALLTAALAVSGLACGGSGTATELVITGYSAGHVLRFTLECDPARGTAPRPRVLCSALERDSKLLLEPREVKSSSRERINAGCTVGLSTMLIEGKYRGKAVAGHFGECAPGDQSGTQAWARLLGIGLRRDQAVDAIWRAARRGDPRSVESISRFHLSVYQRVRLFHVKYNSDRCEIWTATRANGGVGSVRKLRDEKPCYASAPWRRSRR